MTSPKLQQKNRITHGYLEANGWQHLGTNSFFKDKLHIWLWDAWTLQISPCTASESAKEIASGLKYIDELDEALREHELDAIDAEIKSLNERVASLRKKRNELIHDRKDDNGGFKSDPEKELQSRIKNSSKVTQEEALKPHDRKFTPGPHYAIEYALPCMMQRINDGEDRFSFRPNKPGDDKTWNVPCAGLTKREAFTMAAMQGLCADRDLVNVDQIADSAVKIARATLNVLSAPSTPAPVLEVWHRCNNELPPVRDLECETSAEVLIDLDGKKEDYRVGWYDHGLRMWVFHDSGCVGMFDINHAKYRFI